MSFEEADPKRIEWARRRAALEVIDAKRMPDGRRHSRLWKPFKIFLAVFGLFLRCVGLYRRGLRNALDIRLVEHEISFPGLPDAFDGYRVLHLTDLHLDGHPALPGRIADRVAGVSCDLCVLTGDYRFGIHGASQEVTDGFARLLPEIEANDGIMAVLGNHDAAEMVAMLENNAVRVLVNQTVTLTRGLDAIHITGADDPHYYFTEEATRALDSAPDGFRIALVHTPELSNQAADAGVDLYLTGHTHGGHVCLPGGIPIITHASGYRRYASGLWRKRGMTGYTSRGAGFSGLPVRFNCPPEVTLFTLRGGRPAAIS